MKYIFSIFPSILFILAGCENLSPEEITIQKLIQTTEVGQKAQTITPLKGGKSKSDLFLVTSTSGHKYVARFFPHENQEGRERIVTAHKIASQQGYGPLVFYASASDAVILMDYLEPDPENKQHTPEKMAALLRLIHQGPKFPSSWNILDRTEQNLTSIEPHHQQLLPISKIRAVLQKMMEQLSKISKNVPCHRDLNPGNVIVSGGKYWAIDYDDAANDDPFLDLAMAGLLHNYTQQENQHLLEAYQGHPPTAPEMRKFNLCRRIALLFKATEILVRLPDDQWNTSVDTTTIPPFEELLSGVRSGTFSLDNLTNQLTISRSGIQSVISTADDPSLS